MCVCVSLSVFNDKAGLYRRRKLLQLFLKRWSSTSHQLQFAILFCELPDPSPIYDEPSLILDAVRYIKLNIYF